jgi:hypothetical protein
MSKIYEKRVTVGQFLKKGVDIKDGELVEIANEGKEVEGQFGMQDVFLIKTASGKEGNISINQTSINGFVDAWGKEATNWIGKKVKVVKIKQNVSGKFIDVYYFAHPEAELTENGFVLPSTEVKEEATIDPADIPF